MSTIQARSAPFVALVTATIALAACSDPERAAGSDREGDTSVSDVGGIDPFGVFDSETPSIDATPEPEAGVDLDARDAHADNGDSAGDAVAESCGPEAPCLPGSRCVERRCVPACDVDADCARGERCGDRVCEPVVCAAHADCRHGERCEAATCVSWRGQNCDVAAECGLFDTCSGDHCVDIASLAMPPRWRAIEVDMLTAHAASLQEAGIAGYGNGGALVDIDGDLDLDVFLGGDTMVGTTACLYVNESSPGRLTFTRHPDYCDLAERFVASGFAVDVERDGVEELVVLGAGLVDLVRFEPEFEVEDLLAPLGAESTARSCFAGAGIAADLDRDGLIDLYVACQIPLADPPASRAPSLGPAMENLVFIQAESGRFELASDDSWDVLEESGISLAVAGVDLDHNGLLDLMVADDAFSSEGARRLDLYPATARVACAPTEDCRYRMVRFVDGAVGYGSFMGIGAVAVRGDAPDGGDWRQLFYVTDIGSNRLLEYRGNRFDDVASELGVGLRGSREVLWYGWAALVDDYDRNGTDDVFVSQGALDEAPGQSPGYEDTLLLQRGDGAFVAQTGWVVDVGGDPVEMWRYSSRGAARADLDNNGLLDVIVVGAEGRPRVMAEDAPERNVTDRCTLVARTRVVHADGVGFAVASAADGVFRTRDIQGQTRFGQSSHIVTTAQRGHLRFPSGAEVYFDCAGGPGPIVVEEPDWIEVVVDNADIDLRLDAPWLDSVEGVTFAFGGGETNVEVAATRRADTGWNATIPDGASRLMVAINGRWIGRWWPL